MGKDGGSGSCRGRGPETALRHPVPPARTWQIGGRGAARATERRPSRRADAPADAETSHRRCCRSASGSTARRPLRPRAQAGRSHLETRFETGRLRLPAGCRRQRSCLQPEASELVSGRLRLRGGNETPIDHRQGRHASSVRAALFLAIGLGTAAADRLSPGPRVQAGTRRPPLAATSQTRAYNAIASNCWPPAAGEDGGRRQPRHPLFGPASARRADQTCRSSGPTTRRRDRSGSRSPAFGPLNWPPDRRRNRSTRRRCRAVRRQRVAGPSDVGLIEPVCSG